MTEPKPRGGWPLLIGVCPQCGSVAIAGGRGENPHSISPCMHEREDWTGKDKVSRQAVLVVPAENQMEGT